MCTGFFKKRNKSYFQELQNRLFSLGYAENVSYRNIVLAFVKFGCNFFNEAKLVFSFFPNSLKIYVFEKLQYYFRR